MEIIDLVKRFAGHSGVAAVHKVWSDDSVRTMHFKGLSASLSKEKTNFFLYFLSLRFVFSLALH